MYQEALGGRVPGFQWEHAEYIAGIETLCPAFAQQEHPVHIWNVIWVCAPNVPISNILFTAGMRPCHVSKMYPPGTFQMLSTHVYKMFPAYAQWACCGYMHFVWMFSAFSSIFWCTFKMLFKTNQCTHNAPAGHMLGAFCKHVLTTFGMFLVGTF
jgi:hypothetical protein